MHLLFIDFIQLAKGQLLQRLGSGKYKKTHFIVNDPAWTFVEGWKKEAMDANDNSSSHNH